MSLSSRRVSIYKLVGKRVSAELRRPASTESGKVPVWDDVQKKWKAGTALIINEDLVGHEFFQGDDVETEFVLSAPGTVAIFIVDQGGQILEEGDQYTKDNTTKTITLAYPLPASQRLGVHFLASDDGFFADEFADEFA